MGAPALPVTDRTCSWCVHDLPSGAPSGPAGVGDPWAPSPHSRRPWGGIAQTTEPWCRASDGYQLTRERLAPSNSGLRAARDEDVEASDDGGLEESTGLRREHVEADEIVQVVGRDHWCRPLFQPLERVCSELTDQSPRGALRGLGRLSPAGGVRCSPITVRRLPYSAAKSVVGSCA